MYVEHAANNEVWQDELRCLFRRTHRPGLAVDPSIELDDEPDTEHTSGTANMAELEDTIGKFLTDFQIGIEKMV